MFLLHLSMIFYPSLVCLTPKMYFAEKEIFKFGLQCTETEKCNQKLFTWSSGERTELSISGVLSVATLLSAAEVTPPAVVAVCVGWMFSGVLFAGGELFIFSTSFSRNNVVPSTTLNKQLLIKVSHIFR